MPQPLGPSEGRHRDRSRQRDRHRNWLRERQRGQIFRTEVLPRLQRAGEGGTADALLGEEHLLHPDARLVDGEQVPHELPEVHARIGRVVHGDLVAVELEHRVQHDDRQTVHHLRQLFAQLLDEGQTENS